MKLDITTQQHQFIVNVIKNLLPTVSMLAFGSRTDGTAKRYSDLDLALDDGEKISLKTLDQIEESFAQSDLPFKIDILDISNVSPEFAAKIKSRHIKL